MTTPVAWMRPNNRMWETTARVQFVAGAKQPPIGTFIPLFDEKAVKHAEQAMQARIDELEQEVAQARGTGQYWKDNTIAANVRIAELETELARVRNSDDHNFQRWQDTVAERDAFKADAERYRWLRDGAPISLRVRIMDVYDDCDMDRSIDAAKGE